MSRKATSARTRIATFTPDMPTDWSPTSIVKPETGLPFSDESAWLLMSELLASDLAEGPLLRQTELRKPPGLIGVEMLYDFDVAKSLLYMKVHMGARDKVAGRSFHLSDRGRLTW